MRLVVNDLNRSDSFTLTDSQTGISVGQVPQDSTNQNQTNQERTSTDTLEESNRFISQATRLVIENISNSNFTIDRLCREMAMSRTLFYVKLKSYTGKSPQDFIRIIRLERAASMLRNGRSVSDAATLTGFDNPKYFSTVFKKYFGVSPSKYQ
jgi:AraC-like DNA-binding protein